MLKKFFPASWLSKNVPGLIGSVLIYAVLGFLFGRLSSATKTWFVIKFFTTGLFYLVGIYCVAGIIVSLVLFLKNKSENSK